MWARTARLLGVDGVVNAELLPIHDRSTHKNGSSQHYRHSEDLEAVMHYQQLDQDKGEIRVIEIVQPDDANSLYQL
jgi:hypothetical protein